MTATKTMKVQAISPKLLHPHPKNPHGELREDDPRNVELHALITAEGQNQNCIVRPHKALAFEGEYEIIVGHRRVFVCAQLGIDAQCVVADLDDARALKIMLTDNGSHVPVDPFLEADAVTDLLELPGWTLKDVADQLVRPIRWVSLRASLKNVTEKLRKVFEDGKLEDWPIEWLAEVGRLTPEVQDELAIGKSQDWHNRLTYVRSKQDLDRLLGEHLHVLGKAPWSLTDATLLPKAGTCTACPKTSLACPSLFDGAETDPQDPKALSKALCRDSACWKEKAVATTKAEIAALKKENPEAVVAKTDYHMTVPKGVKALDTMDAPVVTKGTKGAQAAVLVDKDGGVKPREKNPSRSSSSSSSSPKKPKAPIGGAAPKKGEDWTKRFEASKKEVAARRAEWAKRNVDKLIEDAPVPLLKVLQGLVSAFGFYPPTMGVTSYGPKGFAETKKFFSAAQESSPKDFVLSLWPRVRFAITEDIHDEGERAWLMEVLELDLATLDEKAKKEIPDPAWWGKGNPLAIEKFTPAPKVKRIPRTHAAASAKDD